MKCPACGAPNPETTEACERCGTPLSAAEPVDEAAGAGRSEETETRPSPSFPRTATTKAGDRREQLAFAPGQPFGPRYIIIDRLGKGGMGVVYKAYDRELDRTVALKMIRAEYESDPAALQRFRRELGLAQQVTHSNVCRVHDLGEAEGIRYLSMEYLEGRTLAALIREVGSLSAKQTLEIADQFCAGMEAIHERGIVHRDLKPSNIGIDAKGRVVVMDFGVARRSVDPDLTRPGAMVGSYAYLAPEQVGGGQLDERADIYAIGLVLYEMLTGRRPPGDEDSRPLALRGEHAPCTPPSTHELDVPPALDALILRCLSWDAGDRPASVADVRTGLQEFLAQEETRKEAGRPKDWGKRWAPRKWAPLAAGVVLLLALGLFALPKLRTWRAGPVPIADRTVAVLPFHYEGDDPGQEYLGPLVSDALIAGLRSVPGFETAAYETTQEFADVPVVDVASVLDVGWVVHGTVAAADGVLVVSAQLDSKEGATQWRARRSGSLRWPLEVLDRIRKEMLGQFALKEQPSEKAIAELRTASFNAYEKYLQARSHHDGWPGEADLDRAQGLYQDALEIDPDFGAAHAGLAMVLIEKFHAGREPHLQAAATNRARGAMAINPDLPEAWIASGMVQAESGSWEEAAEAFKRAFELAPGNDAVCHRAARLYERLGRFEEARGFWERAVDTRDYWRNHYLLGYFVLWRQSDVEPAGLHFERALERLPEAFDLTGESKVLTNLGYYHMIRGDLEGAEVSFRKSLGLSSDPEAQYRLGLIYYYRGEYEAALDTWQEVLMTKPDKAMWVTAVADALRQSGRRDEARQRYTEALDLLRRDLEQDPESQDLRWERTWVLAAIGDCGEATKEMEGLFTALPGSPEIAYYAALTASRCGDTERARGLVLESLAKGSVVGIRFDPDLESIRQDEEVAKALALIPAP